MIKKTITYTDLNGLERTEDFWFNLSKSELTKMELSHTGGLSAVIEQITASKDQEKLINMFDDVILRSYGVRSEDGKKFIKSKQLSEEFSHSIAYDILFMELIQDTDKMSEFFNGIVPKN